MGQKNKPWSSHKKRGKKQRSHSGEGAGINDSRGMTRLFKQIAQEQDGGTRKVLPSSIKPFQDVVVAMPEDFSQRKASLFRPLTLWGLLRDKQNGDIETAVGFLRTTGIIEKTGKDNSRLPVAGVLLAGQDLHRLLNTDKDVILSAEQLHMVPNQFSFFKPDQTPRDMDPVLLPDIIVRRVIGLLHFNWRAHYDPLWTKEYTENLVWDGPVLDGLTHDDIHDGYSWQPDLADSGVAVSRSCDSVMGRDEIARLVQVAKNYADFCMQKRLPIILPRPGAYHDWPEEFLKFETPQTGHVGRDWTYDVVNWQADVLKSHIRRREAFQKRAFI